MSCVLDNNNNIIMHRWFISSFYAQVSYIKIKSMVSVMIEDQHAYKLNLTSTLGILTVPARADTVKLYIILYTPCTH